MKKSRRLLIAAVILLISLPLTIFAGDWDTPIIPLDPHTHKGGAAVTENVVKATCTEDGSYDSVIYCRTCGAEMKRTHKTVAKLGHSIVPRETVEPTCETAGYQTGECSRCGITETVEIPAKGHTYECAGLNNEGNFDFTCSVCGEGTVSYSPEYIYAKWDVKYVNHHPSDFATGYLLDVCNDKIINAKDYAIIRNACNQAQ